MKRFAFLLALACTSSCIEDNTRDIGEDCYEDADCIKDYICADCAICALNENVTDCPVEEDDDGGYITCNDGTKSASCTTCDSGCCSGHGGCS